MGCFQPISVCENSEAQVQFSLENVPNLLVQSYFQVVLATPTANYHEQKLEKHKKFKSFKAKFVGVRRSSSELHFKPDLDRTQTPLI